MNRENKAPQPKAKGEVHPWSGHYGSKSAMVKESITDTLLVCEDEHGVYVTRKEYIDAKSLDPNRMYRRKSPEAVREQLAREEKFSKDLFLAMSGVSVPQREMEVGGH